MTAFVTTVLNVLILWHYLHQSPFLLCDKFAQNNWVHCNGNTELTHADTSQGLTTWQTVTAP